MMMPWYFFASWAVIGISIFNIAAKSITGLTPALFNMLYSSVVLLVSISYFTFRHFTGEAPFNVPTDAKSWMYVILAGVGVNMINLGYAEMYGRGVEISIGANAIIMASLVTATLIGVFVFKEQLSMMKGLGLMLGLGALICFMKG